MFNNAENRSKLINMEAQFIEINGDVDLSNVAYPDGTLVLVFSC